MPVRRLLHDTTGDDIDKAGGGVDSDILRGWGSPRHEQAACGGKLLDKVVACVGHIDVAIDHTHALRCTEIANSDHEHIAWRVDLDAVVAGIKHIDSPVGVDAHIGGGRQTAAPLDVKGQRGSKAQHAVVASVGDINVSEGIHSCATGA